MGKKRFRLAVLLDASRAYDRDVLKGITHFNKLYDKFNFFFYSPKYLTTGGQSLLLRRIVSWEPEGIIAREMEGLEKLQALAIPFIVSPHTKLYEGCCNLWADNESIGQLAAQYFLDKGYKNFGFIGFKNFQWSAERQQAFENRIRQEGLVTESFLFDYNNMQWEDLPLELVQWLNKLQKPCAVFSATDELNIHLLEAAKEINYKVPDELAVLGVDNDELLCEMTQPTLSSIDQNAFGAGYEIAERMLQWLERNEGPTGNFVIKPKTVIERHSTSLLAIEDEQVRSALNYIHTHAPFADIDVMDVVGATTHSRRILEKKFNQLLHSSILDEIKKVRIERIKNFLTESDLTVQQIAYEMDFNNPDNITRYFKQSTGFKPLEYRKKYHRHNKLK